MVFPLQAWGGGSLTACEPPVGEKPDDDDRPSVAPLTGEGSSIPTRWNTIKWTKKYLPGDAEDSDEVAYLDINWTHGLDCEEKSKPSKRQLRMSIRKQLKHHRRALKKYRRSLRVKDKETPKTAKVNAPTTEPELRDPTDIPEITPDLGIPMATNPDADIQRPEKAVPALKDLGESLRKTILDCIYYRNKYMKRLKTIALAARQSITAQPEVTPSTEPPKIPRPTSVHDPEVEQDCRAFSDLEGMVRSWFKDWHRLPDWDFYGTSRREMEGISHDFNWLSFVPYSEETPLLIPDLGLHPFTGKVRTLGEVLQDPACSPLRPLLVPLQKFLRAQEVFRDDRRQVAMVGGRHGFHVCSWVPVPTRPYSRDGVPLYDFAPPLTGLPWEPCGNLDLGLSTKCRPYWGPHFLSVPEETTSDFATSTDTTVNSASESDSDDVYMPKAKTQFENTLDAFTAFCGDACFPVVYDSGASITLHPTSYREMLIREGFKPALVGHRKVCTEGFTGAPVVTTVPIYELHLRLWDDSVPVVVRSHEFRDFQTNVKTLLFGRPDIWANNWFLDRDPQEKPSLRVGTRYKPLVRAKGHLFRPMAYDLHQPEPYQRPDLLHSKDSASHTVPDLIGSIRELGGWYTRPPPRPAPKGAIRTFADYLACSMRASERRIDRGVLDAMVDLVPRPNRLGRAELPPSPTPIRHSISKEEDILLNRTYQHCLERGIGNSWGG